MFCLCKASTFNVLVKAEINQERYCIQRECQETLVNDGEGDELDRSSVNVGIKLQEGSKGIEKVVKERGNRPRRLAMISL